MVPVKVIRTAEEEFKYTNNNYTEDLKSLSVRLGNGQQELTPGVISLEDGAVQFSVVASGNFQYVMGQDIRLKNIYKHYLPDSPQFAGGRHCEALRDDNKANKLCLALNGVEIGTNGEYRVYALDGRGGNGTFQCAPSCLGNQVCENQQCKCPDAIPTWDGSKCSKLCGAGEKGCSCPAKTPLWNGEECVSTCSGGQVFTGWGTTLSGCSCPAKTPLWNGEECVNKCTEGTECINDCQGGQVNIGGGICRCPSAKPVWNGVECINDCQGGQVNAGDGICRCPANNPIWDGNQCIACPGGQIISGGQCVCPSAKPVWDGARCTEK
jgi:hypothetical protein